MIYADVKLIQWYTATVGALRPFATQPLEQLYSAFQSRPMSLLKTKHLRATAYVLSECLTTLTIRLPIWALLALPKGSRTRPSWSFEREILFKLLKRIIRVAHLYVPIYVNYTTVRELITYSQRWASAEGG